MKVAKGTVVALFIDSGVAGSSGTRRAELASRTSTQWTTGQRGQRVPERSHHRASHEERCSRPFDDNNDMHEWREHVDLGRGGDSETRGSRPGKERSMVGFRCRIGHRVCSDASWVFL